MAALSVERRLAAILCADVFGYSRLMGEDELGTVRAFNASREVLDGLIRRHHGRVFGGAGDSVIAEFPSAVEAVACAAEIQAAIAERNADLPESRRMRFRIGVNLGDIVVDGANLVGDGVNVAARLEALAEPGGILISGAAFDQVEGKLDHAFDRLGEKRLKNIARPVRLYRVRDGPDRGGFGPRVRRVAAARPFGWSAIGLGLVLALGLIAWFLYVQPSLQERAFTQATVLPLPDKPSIAVLPFANLSADPEQEYFSDGITDDLITNLSQLSGLFVIARNTAFTYKGQPVDMREVGRELGVRYLLEGSVQTADGRVRVNAQLIDAATGFHVWAERFDHQLGDVFALQDKVAASIVDALEVTLSEDERRRLAQRYTSSLEAYDAFLRGWEQYWRGVREGNLEARRWFERALELDPTFARALANLALTYVGQASGFPSLTSSPDRAYELVQRALALDERLPQVHWVLGEVELYRRNYAGAQAAIERAIALDPNWADAHAQAANILIYSGRPEEALGVFDQAMRLNPRFPAPYLRQRGKAYLTLHRYEQAIADLEEALRRNPTLWDARLFLAASYAHAGRIAEAEWEIAEVLVAEPDLSLRRVGEIAPYKERSHLEHLLDGLRKAGLMD